VNEPWVLPPPDSVIGLVAMEAFGASGLKYPRTTVITLPAEVRISLLATGRFLSIFPASLLRFPITRTGLKAMPVNQAFTRVPVGIVTLKNRTINPLAQLFIEHAREVAKSLEKNR
jgi:DNA-binding transcriptional LysR family regulator